MTQLLRRMVPRQARLAASRWRAGRISARFADDMRALAGGNEMIVAGPWLGEVGFELLYWVPFLAWCAAEFGIARERWVVMSRGGTAGWYRGFASHYSDVFEQVTPDEFREEHDRRVRALGEQKQTRMTEFEDRLVAGAVAKAGLSSWSLLHPSRMYEVLNPFWWGHLDSSWVRRHTRYARLQVPSVGGIPLPAGSYVAAKFYFNECFPPTDRNRAFASRVLRTLASEGPVISLSTRLAIDDHVVHASSDLGVQHLPDGLDPSVNLEVQTALVAGARAFVGTYGGFSYLAPFHHVPSYAFYSDAGGFSARHLALAREALACAGAPGTLHVSDVAASVPELPPTHAAARPPA